VKALVTGGAGRLGSALLATAPAGVEVHATWRGTPLATPRTHRVELAGTAQVGVLLEALRPDVVIHTAYSQRDLAGDVVAATRNLARAAAARGARLVNLSTDMVYGGDCAPYAEGDTPAPINEYGRAKLEAEAEAAAMAGAANVRTSLIVRTLAKDETVTALRNGTLPPAFVDELRSPIADVDLARQLWELAALPAEQMAGVWHLAGPESVSRYTLAVLLARSAGLDPAAVGTALNRDFLPPRPRDLRLLTARADRELTTRARPISEVLADLAPETGSA
jgi:dTDP-4-dehydrorhamnose reductase